MDEEGELVIQSSDAAGTLKVDPVQLRQLGVTCLYQLWPEILNGNQPEEMLNTFKVSVGVRSVEVQGNKFLINGKPFYFTGFGKHEDTPVRGKGNDPVYMLHDFQLMP